MAHRFRALDQAGKRSVIASACLEDWLVCGNPRALGTDGHLLFPRRYSGRLSILANGI